MENLKITRITHDEITELQQISRNTFFEAFSAVNTAEDMNSYLDESFSIGKLTEELNNELSQFYFAWVDGKVVAYLKLNLGKAQTELKEKDGLEIERIYVMGAYHGKKVGQLLYEKAIQIATEINAKYVWLGVWENNHRAISFYSKNGFVEFDKHAFWVGTDKQMDLMMKKVLKNDNHV